MAQQELENALRREGEDQARAIWQRIEMEASQLRDATRQNIEQQRQTAVARWQREANMVHEKALSVARRESRNCRLHAEDALAQRMKTLALELLFELAGAEGSTLFEALAVELPDHPWQQVRVHPRDQEQARKIFPAAEIMADEEISGGLEVVSADARIHICNTLGKRLEHLWPQLLSELMHELRQIAGDHESLD
ncbi:MAG: V-type ATP synthase subunit E family protein [Desulfuromonadales bacterium]|nr:V-type ATP synthase subunit E family protein [Desulfuromonadales bacterium]MDT8422153.1 V-type ATP synthase subunit E family protein [Desulfuromonadales bacterium]